MVQERTDNLWDPPEKPRERGFSGFVTEQLGVSTTAQSKASVFSAICLAADKGEFVAPASETELRRRMALLEVELTPTGGERIQASIGHDDLCDALYLACGPYRNDAGEWSSSMADWIDPRYPLPRRSQSRQLSRRAPHLVDAEGLAIPARPAWQSITGQGLTVPQGLELAAPEDPRVRAVQEQVREAVETTNQEVAKWMTRHRRC